MSDERLSQIFNLERDVRHGLHEVGVWCLIPISLPLNAERIAQMVTDGNAKVRQIDFAIESFGRRNSDVIEFHDHA